MIHRPIARRTEGTTQILTTSTKRPQISRTTQTRTSPVSSSTSVPSGTPSNTADSQDGSSSVTRGWMIVLIIVLVILLLSLLFIYLRVLRYKHANPRYLPSPLKSLWKRWNPRSKYGGLFGMGFRTNMPQRQRQWDPNTAYEPSLSTAEAPGSHPLTETQTQSTNLQDSRGVTQNDNVNRNTSVRSIMTLPPYNPAPLPSERLIAREGERAGVDTVIEFPETAEEEEAQREEDMEALYQIRQARRLELEQREARREERRMAREAGDWARLEQMRLESQARTRARAQSAISSTASLQAPDSATLFAEHTARASSRDRRVSSVSYAALGVARHDGSRIRADSVDSTDDRPLLDSAASMGGRGSNEGSRRSSYTNLPHRHHQRGVSTSSAFSHDEDVVQHTPAGSSGPSDRHNSDENNRRPSILTPGSSETSPPGMPPEYDPGEAPAYTGPTREVGDPPSLPPIQPIPSIEVTVTTPMTPSNGRGAGR